MINATHFISILDAHLLVFINIHGCMPLQQDSVPCPKAKAVIKRFQTKDVNELKSPENFLDLNTIENLWTLIKQKIFRSNPRIWRNYNKLLKRFDAKILSKICAKIVQILYPAVSKMLSTTMPIPY